MRQVQVAQIKYPTLKRENIISCGHAVQPERKVEAIYKIVLCCHLLNMQISAFHRIFIYSSVIKGGKNVCSSASNYNLPNILEKETKRLDALDNLCNDLSEVTPYFPKSFNLAAYVNKSELLQNLLHLDVNLSKIEKKPYIAEKILKLDFERDVKRHVMFLKDFVESEEMGNYITKNPMILCEPLEDLEVRVNYLKSKRFLNTQVQQIVSRNPYWLMFR